MTRPELALSRFRTAVLLDLRLQRRYGFYYAAAFVTVVWIALLRLLPPWTLATAAPFVIFSDLAVVGYYFVAALVLYEKGEATLSALVVTPLRFWEYLASKLATLTGLAVAISLVLVLAAVAGSGVGVNLPLIVLGVLFTSLIASLVGFISVAPFTSISSYWIPSALPLLILGLPVIDYFGLWQSPLFYLIPTYGALLLLGGAFGSIEAWQVIYALLYPLVWLALLAWCAHWAFDRYVVGRQGGR